MIHYGGKLIYLSTIIRREIDNLDAIMQMEKVSGTNGFILAYIYNHKDTPVFQKDIEHAFGITRSTCSKVLSLMEKKGMLIRKNVSGDARLKQLCLTEKAEEFVVKLDDAINEFERNLMDGISEEDKKHLLDTLIKMEGNLGSRRIEKCVD